MKIFKTIDICLQIALLVLIGIRLASENIEQLNPMVFILAFALTQIISILVNKAAGKQYWKKKPGENITLSVQGWYYYFY